MWDIPWKGCRAVLGRWPGAASCGVEDQNRLRIPRCLNHWRPRRRYGGVWVGRLDATPMAGYFGAVTSAPILFHLLASLPVPSGVRKERPPSVRAAEICWPLGTEHRSPDDPPCGERRAAWVLNGWCRRRCPTGRCRAPKGCWRACGSIPPPAGRCLPAADRSVRCLGSELCGAGACALSAPAPRRERVLPGGPRALGDLSGTAPWRISRHKPGAPVRRAGALPLSRMRHIRLRLCPRQMLGVRPRLPDRIARWENAAPPHAARAPGSAGGAHPTAAGPPPELTRGAGAQRARRTQVTAMAADSAAQALPEAPVCRRQAARRSASQRRRTDRLPPPCGRRLPARIYEVIPLACPHCGGSDADHRLRHRYGLGHPHVRAHRGTDPAAARRPRARANGRHPLTRARHSTPKPPSRRRPSNSPRPCAGKVLQRSLSPTGTAAFAQLAGKTPPQPPATLLGPARRAFGSQTNLDLGPPGAYVSMTAEAVEFPIHPIPGPRRREVAPHGRRRDEGRVPPGRRRRPAAVRFPPRRSLRARMSRKLWRLKAPNRIRGAQTSTGRKQNTKRPRPKLTIRLPPRLLA